MSEEQLVQWLASIGVTVLAGYVLSQLVDKKTAALISPLVLGAARAYLVPRVAAFARKPRQVR